jgi:hypothetical protein
MPGLGASSNLLPLPCLKRPYIWMVQDIISCVLGGWCLAWLWDVRTSRSSSLVGVWERLRLSSTAFLNSADSATIFAVGGIGTFGLLVRCSVMYLVGTVCREEMESGMPDDVICSTLVVRACVS